MYSVVIVVMFAGIVHVSLGQDDCPPGTFINETQCEDCPLGTYSDLWNQTSCTNCTAGTFGNDTGLVECFQCSPGSSTNGMDGETACMECSPGTYANDTGQASCTDCPIGQFAESPGSLECMPCDNGTFANTTGSPNCRPCLAGFFAPGVGETECTACLAGTFASDQGMDTCLNCALGTFANTTGSTACLDCSAGFIGNDTGREDCVPCPAGFVSSTTGLAECTPCGEGEFAGQPGQSECQQCAMGTFNNMTGQDNCQLCPLGMTNLILGATMEQQCDISQCIQGQYYDNLTCVECPVGSYQAQREFHILLSCQLCPDQYTTAQNGSDSPTDCYRRCEAGQQPNVTGVSGGCEACPQDQYQPLPDQSACLPCPDSTGTQQPGASNVTLCELFCLEGQGDDGSGVCAPCPIGYYHNITDGRFSDCQRCPAEFITEETGSVSADNCTIANCSAGSYRNVTTNTCVPCPLDTYQPDPWKNDSCISCPGNYTTLHEGSTNISDCLVPCVAGEYNVAWDTCDECVRGTYKEDVGAALSCTLCPAENITEGVGADSVLDCNVGNCTEGQFTGVDRTCELCPVGTYQDDWWQDDCKPCGSNSRGIQLSTPAEGTKIREDCFDPIDRDNPAVTSVVPDIGPVAGGSVVILHGRGFRALSIRVFLGNDVECTVNSWTETTITIETPAMNETAAGEVFSITVELDGLNNVTSSQNFTYAPNPTISDIFPLITIRSGGTTLTVLGENLDVIANPKLISRVFIETIGQPSANVTEEYLTQCTVKNATLMTCVLPHWSFPANLNSSNRVRRQSLERVVSIFLGFRLDDLADYLDVAARGDLNGTLTLVNTPIFEEQNFDFEPDTNIRIKGTAMRTQLLNDYTVVIGADGVCELMELTDDALICRPPQEAPARVPDSDSTDPRVLVNVGTNYNTSLGTIDYSIYPGTTLIIVITVVCSAVVIGVIVAVVICIYVQRRRHQQQKQAQRAAQTDGIIVLPDPEIEGGTIASKRANSLSGRHRGAAGLDRLFTAGPPREDVSDRKNAGFGKKRPPVSNDNFIMYPSHEKGGKKRLLRQRASAIPAMDEDEELSQAFNNYRQTQPSRESYLTPRDVSRPDGSPGPSDPYTTVFDVNDNVRGGRPRSAAPTKEGIEFDRVWDRVGEDDGPKFSDKMMTMMDKIPKGSQPQFSTATADMW